MEEREWLDLWDFQEKINDTPDGKIKNYLIDLHAQGLKEVGISERLKKFLKYCIDCIKFDITPDVNEILYKELFDENIHNKFVLFTIQFGFTQININ